MPQEYIRVQERTREYRVYPEGYREIWEYKDDTRE